jgi:hypothetical protein
MAFFRCNGISISKLSNAQCASVVSAMLGLGVSEVDLSDFIKDWHYSEARIQVKYAVAAIDLAEQLHTKTTYVAPSPESLAWSNMEGGHIFHETPNFASIVSSAIEAAN